MAIRLLPDGSKRKARGKERPVATAVAVHVFLVVKTHRQQQQSAVAAKGTKTPCGTHTQLSSLVLWQLDDMARCLRRSCLRSRCCNAFTSFERSLFETSFDGCTSTSSLHVKPLSLVDVKRTPTCCRMPARSLSNTRSTRPTRYIHTRAHTHTMTCFPLGGSRTGTT